MSKHVLLWVQEVFQLGDSRKCGARHEESAACCEWNGVLAVARDDGCEVDRLEGKVREPVVNGLRTVDVNGVALEEFDFDRFLNMDPVALGFNPMPLPDEEDMDL